MLLRAVSSEQQALGPSVVVQVQVLEVRRKMSGLAGLESSGTGTRIVQRQRHHRSEVWIVDASARQDITQPRWVTSLRGNSSSQVQVQEMMNSSWSWMVMVMVSWLICLAWMAFSCDCEQNEPGKYCTYRKGRPTPALNRSLGQLTDVVACG